MQKKYTINASQYPLSLPFMFLRAAALWSQLQCIAAPSQPSQHNIFIWRGKHRTQPISIWRIKKWHLENTLFIWLDSNHSNHWNMYKKRGSCNECKNPRTQYLHLEGNISIVDAKSHAFAVWIYRSVILSKIQHLHLANEIFQKSIGQLLLHLEDEQN